MDGTDRLTAAGTALVAFIAVWVRACINSGAVRRSEAVEMLIILRDRLRHDREAIADLAERERLEHLIAEIEIVLEAYRARPMPDQGAR
jgi:hypothetical protein